MEIGKFAAGWILGTDGARHHGWLAIYAYNSCAIWDSRAGKYVRVDREKRKPLGIGSCELS